MTLDVARQSLLTARLRGRSAPAAPRIARRPDGQAPPLSYAQERMWFLEQFAPGTAAYAVPVTLRLTGPLDVARLRDALGAVVARHETLRSRFPATDDGRPYVELADSVPVELPVLDAAGEDDARRLAVEAVTAGVDLAADPPLRARLIRLGGEDHVLALVVHHIAFDGFSLDVLLGDLFAAYGGDPRPEPRIRYGDYAAWQRDRVTGPDGARDLDYWTARLDRVPVLRLPTDFPRPAQQAYDGAEHHVALGADLSAALGLLARERDATVYMTMLAAWQALLFRWSGQADFAVGTPQAGRGQAELDTLVGLFVNTLVMRADLGGDVSFAGFLDRTRDAVLDAFTHRELPVEHLVSALDLDRDVSRPSLFQVFFAMQNFGGWGASSDTDLGVGPFPLPHVATRFDIELYVTERDGALHAMFVYNTSLFAPETVARLGRHFARLLASAVAAPDRPIADLDIMDATERRRVLVDFNATDTPLDPEATLVSRLAARAAATPDAPAVSFEGVTITYRELERRAGVLAGALAGHAGGRIAVCAERSIELVVALCGILRAGAAYVPLDPDYPADRLAFMLADADVPVLLTQRRLARLLPPTDAEVRYLDDDPATWAPAGDPRPPAPTDAAYVIYTSGSTGRPKGVPNGHRGIVNRLDWMQRHYPLDASDSVLQKTPAGFDVSVWEFFWPLVTGARLVLARPGGHRDPAYLAEIIRSEKITTVHFVPSMLAAFLADGAAASCTGLRRVICSGEELPPAVAAAGRATLPAELYNLYGPTEAAVDVTAWACTPDDSRTVPIGRPVANTRLYVLDPRGNPQPVGVAGELYIAGVQVALGYHRRPALTAERFVPDPFHPGARMYATGDRAAWRPDGALVYLGRLDNQVKIRGVRVELGEVEHALRAVGGVHDAAALVREDRPDDRRLVAYLTGDADPDTVRDALRDRLPEAYVPSAFVRLDALPTTPNGKLDRAALPAPEAASLGAAGEFVAPATPSEIAVAAVWAEVLGVAEIGATSDFFAIGGHSLLATQVVARLRRLAPDARVGVMTLFKHPTVRRLAAIVDGTATATGGGVLHELTRPLAPGRVPTRSLVCVPYGGGSAVVYQPLADALPAGHALWSVAIPGHDIGLDEDRIGVQALADRVADEVQARVAGPIALYGHCGVGSALVVAVARRLEALGRTIDAVYIGAMFPFSRPPGRVMSLLSRLVAREALVGNRVWANWLKSLGVDMDVIEPEQAARIIRNMRADARDAEVYFTELIDTGASGIAAPIVSVVGNRDDAAEYFTERYREWHFLSDSVALVVLDEGGHFFLKYRAEELAAIVTTVDPAVADGRADELTRARRGRDAGWWLHGTSSSTGETSAGPAPSMKRFLAVAAAQLVSMTGSALTDFALPIWIYLQTGSLARFALLTVAGLIPGMLLSPIAGTIVDRSDRRRVMLGGDLAAGGVQAAMAAVYVTGHLTTNWIYLFIACLSAALTFQRAAYGSAIPQLVPKRYLGHANGVAQAAGGIAQVVTPLVAVGLLALIGLGGILALDVASYLVAVAVVLAIEFPRTMPYARREPVLVELRAGVKLAWAQRGMRATMLFFALLNIFLAPLFLLFTPLVLATGTLTGASRIALVTGLGVVAGGVLMGAWGGPRRRRMAGMLGSAAALALSSSLVGIRPNLILVGAGAFGMALFLTLMNGIYYTIIQTKVPVRFHGRVLSISTLVNWSTLPLGFGVIAPLGAAWAERLLSPHGALASSAGRLVGVGPGRGIAFMYVAFALVMLVLVGAFHSRRALGRFDATVPDALPDDLIGEQIRAARRTRVPEEITS